MSTWISEPGAELVGLGVDCEDSGRFGPDAPAWGWTDVFTAAELAQARAAADPAGALCAAFCAKEALFKALGAPFSPLDCELRLSPDAQLVLAPALRRRHGLGGAEARLSFEGPECTVLVQLYGAA